MHRTRNTAEHRPAVMPPAGAVGSKQAPAGGHFARCAPSGFSQEVYDFIRSKARFFATGSASRGYEEDFISIGLFAVWSLLKVRPHAKLAEQKVAAQRQILDAFRRIVGRQGQKNQLYRQQPEEETEIGKEERGFEAVDAQDELITLFDRAGFNMKLRWALLEFIGYERSGTELSRRYGHRLQVRGASGFYFVVRRAMARLREVAR